MVLAVEEFVLSFLPQSVINQLTRCYPHVRRGFQHFQMLDHFDAFQEHRS